MIFTARQLQEKCREHHRDLYIVFVDLTKAFDSVNRNLLWRLLGKIGCSYNLVNIIRSFHDVMSASVVDSGASSKSFAVTNGVKQGCVLAPLLFNIFFSVMLHVMLPLRIVIKVYTFKRALMGTFLIFVALMQKLKSVTFSYVTCSLQMTVPLSRTP